jgi:hypothetical protein
LAVQLLVLFAVLLTVWDRRTVFCSPVTLDTSGRIAAGTRASRVFTQPSWPCRLVASNAVAKTWATVLAGPDTCTGP